MGVIQKSMFQCDRCKRVQTEEKPKVRVVVQIRDAENDEIEYEKDIVVCKKCAGAVQHVFDARVAEKPTRSGPKGPIRKEGA